MERSLRNCLSTSHDIEHGKDIRRGFTRFTIIERGKARNIAAPKFSERVAQKAFAQNVLVPALLPTLTTGCTANVKGRGIDYALTRLKCQLTEWFRKHGAEGYILLMDFADYFGSIDHDAVMEMIESNLADPRAIEFARLQVEANGKGLGLGAEPNQALAVALPSPIDRLGERWQGIEASGRYMDDSYFIAENKATLWAFLEAARSEAARLGITISDRKTRIVKLSRGFVFLKKRFRFSESGKVIVTPFKKAIADQKRKMRKQARLVSAGIMTQDQARTSYASFRGSIAKKHDGKPRFRMNVNQTVRKLDSLFLDLFGVPYN